MAFEQSGFIEVCSINFDIGWFSIINYIGVCPINYIGEFSNKFYQSKSNKLYWRVV